MSSLRYNGQWLDLVRTEELSVTPVMDQSGIDMTCVKVRISVVATFSEMWVGGGKDGSPNPPGGRPSLGMRGWSMPVSIAALKEVLVQPRRPLEYWMGSTLVIEAPQRDQHGNQMAVDAKGGPYPVSCTVTQVIGAKAAFVKFTVECYLSSCSKVLLSNRWRIRSEVDEHAFTTNTITGTAEFRADMMKHLSLQADDFRPWLILPCDEHMKRERIWVDVNELGDKVNYQVVDRTVNYGTGLHSGVTRVECTVNSGMDTPLRSWKDTALGIVQLLPRYATLDALTKPFEWGIPACKMSCMVRVWGKYGVPRYWLFNVAMSMMNDRIGSAVGAAPAEGLFGRGAVVSLYGTINWDSHSPPFVELRGEFFDSQKFFGQGDVLDVEWNEVIRGQQPVLNWSQQTPASQMPKGNNTRAQWIGRLVSQVLSESACQAPQDPPAPGEGRRSIYALDTTSSNGD